MTSLDTPIYDALTKEYAAKEALRSLQTPKEAHDEPE